MSTKLCSVESRLRYHGLGATLLPGVGEPSRLSVTPKGEPRMPPRRVAFSDSRIEQAAWEREPAKPSSVDGALDELHRVCFLRGCSIRDVRRL